MVQEVTNINGLANNQIIGFVNEKLSEARSGNLLNGNQDSIPAGEINSGNKQPKEYLFQKKRADDSVVSRLEQALQGGNDVPVDNGVTRVLNENGKNNFGTEAEEFAQTNQALNVLKRELQFLVDAGQGETNQVVSLKAQIKQAESDLLLLQLRYQLRSFDTLVEEPDVSLQEQAYREQIANNDSVTLRRELDSLIEQRAATLLAEDADKTAFDARISLVRQQLENNDEQRVRAENTATVASNPTNPNHVTDARLQELVSA